MQDPKLIGDHRAEPLRSAEILGSGGTSGHIPKLTLPAGKDPLISARRAPPADFIPCSTPSPYADQEFAPKPANGLGLQTDK